MGLAASQARLLTITSRRSDCEYQSMDLSHQKIALARDMNIVSAEYQDALDKKKIIYDYYGTGDKTTPLSYGLLMTPSKLNDFIPTTVVDPKGRIVLDEKLAAAARAAGIPQEGLGSVPSEDMRNAFIESLVGSDVMTRSVGNAIKNIAFNPNAGLGDSEIKTTQTRTVTLSEFINEYLSEEYYNFADLTLDTGGSNLCLVDWGSNQYYGYDEHFNEKDDLNPVISFKELLTNEDNEGNEHNYALFGTTWDIDTIDEYGGRNCIIDKVGSSNFWDVLFNTLECRLSSEDTLAQSALDYAKQRTLAKVISLANSTQADITNRAYAVTMYGNSAIQGMFGQSIYYADAERDPTRIRERASNLSKDYVGYNYVINSDILDYGDWVDGYDLNLSGMAQAFYTYFAMYMQGLSTTDYDVTTTKSASNFVTSDANIADFQFDIEEDIDATGDNVMISNFYDCLFNQIATMGWVENKNVNDNEYLATMLRNGTMYLSAMSDDNYYYQKNYSTLKYIKEVTDEEGIAVAEAKYLREKEKIQGKETILDMKLKNLDTEISSLNTEYETIKSVITDNIGKIFTRYKA